MNYVLCRAALLEEIKAAKCAGKQAKVDELLELHRIVVKLEQQEQNFTREQIMQYAQRIRPVMRGRDLHHPNDDGLYWVEPCKIHGESCFFNRQEIRKAENLQQLATVTTYHDYGGYYGFLRPSVDEAIMQCPTEILDKVCAFEFVKNNNDATIFNNKINKDVLQTIYYGGTLPDDLAAQPLEW